jgi:hypothetical protein
VVASAIENWLRVLFQIRLQRKPQMVQCVQKLKTADTINQTALRITGHKWKTADIWYSRLTKDCDINVQTYWAHLPTREDTQVNNFKKQKLN